MSNNFQLERETGSLSSFPNTKSFFSQLKSWLLPYAFLSPSLVVVTLFFFIPLVIVFILSFTNLDMTNFGILKWWQPANWTLDNYVKIFTNR
jgi:ABC-type sugar transport system permease subunit